jgi:hypothetical protein
MRAKGWSSTRAKGWSSTRAKGWVLPSVVFCIFGVYTRYFEVLETPRPMLHICELLDQAHHQGMINGWICVGRPALKGLDVVIEPCGWVNSKHLNGNSF